LVIDAAVNGWLAGLFESALKPAPVPEEVAGTR
jgi:hypothetical protein